MKKDNKMKGKKSDNQKRLAGNTEKKKYSKSKKRNKDTEGSKRECFVWTDEYEKEFEDAVNQLEKDVVPSKIMKLMNVKGLRRRQVASHLQKYRQRKKKELTTEKPDNEENGSSSKTVHNNQVHEPNPKPKTYADASTQTPPFFDSFHPEFLLNSAPDPMIITDIEEPASTEDIQPSEITTNNAQLTGPQKKVLAGLYEMFDMTPRATGGEIIEQARGLQQTCQMEISNEFSFDAQNEIEFNTETSNNYVLCPQEFDLTDFDFDIDDVLPFETLVGNYQVQSFANDGEVQTVASEVVANSTGIKDEGKSDDDFPESLEKYIVDGNSAQLDNMKKTGKSPSPKKKL